MQTATQDVGIIIGAEAIAREIFGDPALKRKVFYLAGRGELPGIFKLGSQLALSRQAHREGIAALAAAHKRAA